MSPSQSLSPFGFPPVTVSPDQGPVGTRIHLEGDGFTGPDWQDVVRTQASGYGVFLVRDLPDGCELIAGGEFTLRIDKSGHLTSEMTVPESGQCFQSDRTEMVTPGPYVVGIGCHACEVASFQVAQPTTSFDACVGSLDGICKDRVLYLAGDRPHIVAEIRPYHSDMRAILLRRAPDGHWEQVASVVVNDRGRMSWQWVTTDDDVRPDGAWRFRYRIPGHGQSDIVRVTIIAPDF
jgi:hypothetical protein